MPLRENQISPVVFYCNQVAEILLDAFGAMRDLTDPKWIVVKGFLFFVLGLLAAAGLLLADPNPKHIALLAIMVWAFCRFYYFLFCIIEQYVDPTFRFRGIWSVVVYLVRKRRGSPRLES
jgi:hypothetical protein